MSDLLEKIVQELKSCEIRFYVTVADSVTNSLMNLCEKDPFFQVIHTCHESEAVAIGSGLQAAGAESIVVMENAGLFQAVEAVRAIPIDMKIPLILLVTYLGRPRADTTPDECYKIWFAAGGGAGSHVILQGIMTEPIVKAMGIPYEILETADGVKQIPWAMKKAKEIEGPVAILLDSMDKWGR